VLLACPERQGEADGITDELMAGGLHQEISRSSFQPIAERNQNRADVPREERKWYG